jgi:hypothetical protein
MTQRLIYTNGGTNNLQWEVCMFTCFLGILLWAPSSPFNFSPNGGLDKADGLAKSNKKEGGGGKGGGGGGKGESGAPGANGNESPQTTPGANPNGQDKPAPETEQRTESDARTPVNASSEEKRAKEPTQLPPTAEVRTGTDGQQTAISTRGAGDGKPQGAGGDSAGAKPPGEAATAKVDVNPGGAGGASPIGGITPGLGPNSGMTLANNGASAAAGEKAGDKAGDKPGGDNAANAGQPASPVVVAGGGAAGGGGDAGGAYAAASGNAQSTVEVGRSNNSMVVSLPPKANEEETGNA